MQRFRSVIPRRQVRLFHDYFVTHLPSSSLHPDSKSGPHHKLPRSESTPHNGKGGGSIAAATPMVGLSRETTVVRIPLKSAKHHFGSTASRGSRPYNEDTSQAGVIEFPAFAKKGPVSLTRSRKQPGEHTGAESASGDPQVFYFGVFDGHGGGDCSAFLENQLHGYIEKSAEAFALRSSLKQEQEDSTADEAYAEKAEKLEKGLVMKWKDTVGGYFRRFRPEHFNVGKASLSDADTGETPAKTNIEAEAVLMYAYLTADFDFVTSQAAKTKRSTEHDRPVNENDILGEPKKHLHSSGDVGKATDDGFKGGSTCSVAMISTPTPTPFWHPSATCTLITSHVGDTRILICSTQSGEAVPLTTNHHPSSPGESRRLRRFAGTFVTDSFGEERMSGLANTRAFGDFQSKRIGVSAEPEIRRTEVSAAEYSFMVLMSDGVSGTLSDQEVVDIVKEAKTPEQAAKDVVSFATEVSREGDNATCMVVRLGGWERRIEGGKGSMGTKEQRDWRKQDATDPRSRRT